MHTIQQHAKGKWAVMRIERGEGGADEYHYMFENMPMHLALRFVHYINGGSIDDFTDEEWKDLQEYAVKLF